MSEQEQGSPGDRLDPRDPQSDERERRKRSGSASAAQARMTHQASWVDQQIRIAMARGDFDDLPGAGRPLTSLGATHDPDWWLRALVEREQISMRPMSVQLRHEDAELDERLDRISTEAGVCSALVDFNARVVAARYRAPEGPPLVTMPRDVEAETTAWRERRTARLAEQRAAATRGAEVERASRRPRWWRRGDRAGREVGHSRGGR